jgi:esterase/lipase superfamily enzyme
MKPPTVFLGEMTNPEIEEFLKIGHTVIIPTGATEQHGPHGPLLTDVLIPQEVARRIAPKIGALVAPPINYALSYPHVGFTGLAHIRIPTFMAMIGDLCASFATAGFKRIVFLNGHYDDNAYLHSPLDYLPGLYDPWFLERIQQNYYVLAVGNQDPLFDQNVKLAHVLGSREIPHVLDVWEGFGHDWPWWYKMAEKFFL